MLLIGFFLGIVFIVLFRNISLKYNILTSKGISSIGGISMGVAFFFASLAALFVGIIEKEVILGILIPSIVMLFFGIIDDKEELSVRQKFFTQAIAAALLILFGIKTEIVYIGKLANIIITFIWIIGITNAFNHLDIMDGLAAGTVIIVAGAFLAAAVFNKDVTIAFLSSALVGIVFSFLILNLPPARIYMGNSGSHFLGFILSAIALAINYASLEKKTALLSPIFILGFPIFDTAFIMLMRQRKGKSVLMKSNDHIALRLLKLGYSKSKALFLILLLALFFTLNGIMLSRFSNFMGCIIIGVVVLTVLLLTLRMSKVVVND